MLDSLAVETDEVSEVSGMGGDGVQPVVVVAGLNHGSTPFDDRLLYAW